jgi:EmrB/QacA subfamily drug resistance transporter
MTSTVSSARTPDAAPLSDAALPGIRRWLALALILSGTFMVTLDFFIVNVAIPSMQSRLHASGSQMEFVVAGYGLAIAALLITGGRLGDLFGRRRLFMLGMALFTLASAACGLAPDASFLIAARILQGAAGALLQPQVLAMLNTLFRNEDRARAFAWYGIVLGLAATGGQLIGGALIHNDFAGLGWRNCFLINVPVGIFALLLAPRLLPAQADAAPAQTAPRRRLDAGGMLLTVLALSCVLLPLIEGREQAWPLWSWISLGLACLLMPLFVLQQRRKERLGSDPLIPMSLFRNKVFTAGLLVTIVFYAGNASFYFVLGLYLQQGLGLGALDAGLVFSTLAAGFFATSMASARLGAWLGRQAIAIGALLLAAGHGLQYLVAGGMAPAGGASAWMMLVLLVEGAGIGLVMAPLVAKSLSTLAPADAGVASGVLAMMQQVGNALGVAIVGILYYGAATAGDALAVTRGFGFSLLFLMALALEVAFLYQFLVRAEKRPA